MTGADELHEAIMAMVAAEIDRQMTAAAFAKPIRAIVTGINPLRVRLEDGSTDALPFAPDDLVGRLAVTDAVWCDRVGTKILVRGRVGGINGLNITAGDFTVAQAGYNLLQTRNGGVYQGTQSAFGSGFQSYLGLVGFPAGGTPYRYMHVKVNIKATDIMVGFSALANLMYAQILRSDMQCYAYTGQPSAPYQPVYVNYAAGGFVNAYYAPDGYLVLCLDLLGASRDYTGLHLWAWGRVDRFSGANAAILAVAYWSATSGAY